MSSFVEDRRESCEFARKMMTPIAERPTPNYGPPAPRPTSWGLKPPAGGHPAMVRRADGGDSFVEERRSLDPFYDQMKIG
jgi:hypothetical protein